MKKKVIIYGGAFNPPTLAHEEILKKCVEVASSCGGQVWVLPSGNRLDKTINLPRQQRLELVNAMIADVRPLDNIVEVIETELDRTIPVETIDTVAHFTSNYPNHDFHWVFGADSVASMHTWRDGQWLRRNLKIIAIARDGHDCSGLGRNIEIIPVDHAHLSSTNLRHRFCHGLSYDSIVGNKVLKVLIKTPRNFYCEV